jgi:hypothetical protein
LPFNIKAITNNCPTLGSEFSLGWARCAPEPAAGARKDLCLIGLGYWSIRRQAGRARPGGQQMVAPPGEEGLVLGGELGERHPGGEACSATVGGGEALGEADLAGIVEVDQAGIEGGIEMGGEQQAIVDIEPLGVGRAQRPGPDVARAGAGARRSR